MTNWKNFINIINELIKKTGNYKNELNIFQQYLKDEKLQEKVFDLNVSDVRGYFLYCFDKEKIGAINTLNTHIISLRTLFSFLEEKKYNFRELNGLISNTNFREEMGELLQESLKKSIIDTDLLNTILRKLEYYIYTNISKNFKGINDKKRFFNVMISSLYIKLSLILPLKTNEMINLEICDIKNLNNRSIEYNGVVVKLPNSLRKQIIETVIYAEENYDIKYLAEDRLFNFLFKAIGCNKPVASNVNSVLLKVYSELKINKMLEKKEGKSRDRYVYPPESYKATAILSMLNNGVNIVYLKKLTGLDISTLLTNYDYDKKIDDLDVASIDINNGIVKSNYYTYL